MNWNKNAVPFVPSLALNDDWSDYSIDDLKTLCMGNPQMLQITLTDSSMYDRYYKDDMVNIRCTTEMPDAGDALLILPDDSVVFRCYKIENNEITIYPFYEEFEEKQIFPADDITLIGLAKNVVRIG